MIPPLYSILVLETHVDMVKGMLDWRLWVAYAILLDSLMSEMIRYRSLCIEIEGRIRLSHIDSEDVSDGTIMT